MTAARDRADRKGSTPIQIGNTKLTTDSSNNLNILDNSDSPKKIIASEIEIGDSSNKVIIKKGSDNKVQFQTQASGGSATDSNTGGVSVFANVNAMAASSANPGDLAYVTATKKLYVHNGSGWYSFTSEVNSTPVISSPASGATVSLGTDGAATTIEIAATDADPGTTLQFSYAVTTGSLANGGGTTATITSSATSNGTYSALAPSTNTTNTFFKITPTTNTLYAGNFTLTFSVSDSVNVATTVQNFRLAFETFGSTALQLNAGPTTAGNAHIEVPASSDFTLGTNDFTIEGWFFIQGPSPSQDYPSSRVGYRNSVGYTHHLFDFRNVSGTNKRAPMIYVGGSGGNNAQAGSLSFRYYVAGSDRITTSVQFPEIENQWFHVCIARNSGTTTFYINGVSEGTWSDSTNYDEIDKLWIGRKHTSANSNFLGWISNFRLVNGTAVYTSNFTPPIAPLTAIANTKLLTCTKPDAVDDISGRGHTVTKVGTATHATFNPFPWATTGYGSLFFDKNNDRIKYAAGGGNAVTGMGSLSDLTVELWVFHMAGHSDSTTDPNVEEMYVHFTDSLYSGVQMAFGRKRTESSTCPIFCSTSGNPWQNQVYTANAAHDVNRGAWHHVAFVKQGTNLRMYKDGTNVAGNNQTSATNLPSSLRVGEIFIGSDSGNFYELLGYMSNLRISNSARYTSNFTPSTTPFTSDSNTVLLTAQRAAPASGSTVTATDQGPNSLSLTIEGDVRNTRYWPFSYNG